MDDELQHLREERIREIMQQKTQASEPAPVQVLPITAMNLEQTLAAHPLLVIDCWAPWCGPCRRVGPIIESLAKEMAPTVTFGKCNTDENHQISARFQISAIPTILLFSSGKLVGRITGAYPHEVLRSKIVRTFGLRH
jgi:thioredoxin 1